MKNQNIWMAVGLLALPLLARTLWFYPGISIRPDVPTPDYAALTAPLPPFETPAAEEDVAQVGGTVVVDYTHDNQFQPAEIQSLVDKLEQRGGRLEYINDSALLENNLKY